jgi:hypothetical protein
MSLIFNLPTIRGMTNIHKISTFFRPVVHWTYKYVELFAYDL